MKIKKQPSLYKTAALFCQNGYMDGYTGTKGNFSRLRSLVLSHPDSEEVICGISDFIITAQNEGNIGPINSIHDILEESSPHTLYDVLIDLAKKGVVIAPPDMPSNPTSMDCNKILFDYWAQTRNQTTNPNTPDIIHAIGNFYRQAYIPATIDMLIGFADVAIKSPDTLTEVPQDRISVYIHLALNDIKYGIKQIEKCGIKIPTRKMLSYKKYASMALKID